jgi:DNA-directed RNA polymerase specialized sigma24 family protein
MEKAREVAKSLCFYYAVSGALAFQDEATSEAYKALWLCCQRFDPKRQVMQRRKAQIQTDEQFWAIIFEYPLPESIPFDPYANFWMCSIQRVRGGVLDFFRAQRLITKRSKKPGEEQKPTMLHAERFLSLDRPLSSVSNGAYNAFGGGESFCDLLPSSDRADSEDERRHHQSIIGEMKKKANLTPQERRALDLYYSELGYTKAEVSRELGVSQVRIQDLVDSAILKLRNVATASA